MKPRDVRKYQPTVKREEERGRLLCATWLILPKNGEQSAQHSLLSPWSESSLRRVVPSHHGLRAVCAEGTSHHGLRAVCAGGCTPVYTSGCGRVGYVHRGIPQGVVEWVYQGGYLYIPGVYTRVVYQAIYHPIHSRVHCPATTAVYSMPGAVLAVYRRRGPGL